MQQLKCVSLIWFFKCHFMHADLGIQILVDISIMKIIFSDHTNLPNISKLEL